MAFQDRRRNVISASEKFPFSASRLRQYYFHDLCKRDLLYNLNNYHHTAASR